MSLIYSCSTRLDRFRDLQVIFFFKLGICIHSWEPCPRGGGQALVPFVASKYYHKAIYLVDIIEVLQ